ncbi:MAG: SO_0444 family Cu/Zn efflux transporter [Clostridia bacterium]
MVEYFRVLFELFVEMSFYMMLGFLFAGAMHVFITRKTVVRHTGDNSFKSTLKASLLGIPLPLCSCAVLPTVVHMKKNGSSDGAAVSFLISTPQTGIDSIIATGGLLGPFMAVYRPLAALLSGIFGGSLVNAFAGKGLPAKQADPSPDSPECVSPVHGLKGKIKGMLRYGFVDLVDDVSLHFIAGLLVSALITVLLPDDLASSFPMMRGIWPILLMVPVSMPMYICSTSSIPIALALMAKGFSPGAAFVFLFLGPVTNAASLSVIFRIFRRKAAFLYMLATAVSAIALGILLDILVVRFAIPIQTSIVPSDAGSPASIAKYSFAAVFLLLILFSLIKKTPLLRGKKACAETGCKDC